MNIGGFLVSVILIIPIILTPVLCFWAYFLPIPYRAIFIRPLVKLWCDFLFVKLLKLELHKELKIKKFKDPILILSNHQSFVDIGVLMLLYRCGFILKKSLVYTPFGLIAMFVGSIFLQKTDMKSFMKVVKGCQKRLQQKVSMCFFPEGSRSKNGKLLPFKSGLLGVYYKENTPTLLVVQHGGAEVMPTGSYFPLLGKKIVVLECGYLQPRSYASSKEFAKDCFQRMEKGLSKAKKIHSQK